MKKEVVSLAGSNIYIDRYGDKVYYNVFDKNGYIVSKEVEPKFRLFYYRYSIVFVVMTLLGDYFKSVQNTFLFGIGFMVLVESYFRFIFLKKLKIIKNFKKENKTSILEEIIRGKEKDKAIMKAYAYSLLSILVVINAIQQNFNVLFLVVSAIGALYSFYIGIINMIAFNKIKKA